MVESWMCPVCGFPSLHEQPRHADGGSSHEICPSCGFQFGYDDDSNGITFADWRTKWILQGTPWSSIGMSRPDGWDAELQLRSLPDLPELLVRAPILRKAKEIAKNILAGAIAPYDGAKVIFTLHLNLVPGDHCLDGFVYWEDEYEEAGDEDRRSYCERAILKVARDLLDDRYPGGPDWDENAPSVWV